MKCITENRKRNFIKGTPKISMYPVLCRLIDVTIIYISKMDDSNTNEFTTKTAAPRGALRVFCGFVSVDAMSGIFISANTASFDIYCTLN